MQQKSITLCLSALALVTTYVTNADELYVDKKDRSAFREIQDAVDTALPGDTILVRAGTYKPFSVETDDLIIMEASKDANPIVNALGQNFGVIINASRVTIQGLDARNARGQSDQEGEVGDGFSINGGENNRLIGNTASNNDSAGFAIIGGEGHLLEHNHAYNNTLGIATSLIDEDTQTPTTWNNTIRDNTAIENSLDGFMDYYGVGNRFEGNVSSFNGRSGFLSNHSEGTQLINNSAWENGQDGVNLVWVKDLKIANNQFKDNGRHGFAIREVLDSEFKENIASSNKVNGFSADDFTAYNGPGPSIGNKFEDNQSNHNNGYGFYISETAEDNEFEDNSCDGNLLGDSNLPDICEESEAEGDD
ncbi:MAG: right-handed parallel beta-helix repeat-containing protein [Gammaproteobacteria bacterium]|nr:right-handed parallel beta-helix repeat-containing protein [Gammaproteobacteria bacterium]